MNIEEIDKWLDNEYGVSYTRLEELHDFLIEQNMKYQDKIDNLQQENKKLKDNWNKLKEYLENKIDEYSIKLEYLSAERMTQIKNKIQELKRK